ncbi:hypothetical protein, partial [Fischerella thermalis]|uniref:hypothetical protein n=1 Tax=Fischerella thermalis TaxID=372787 RepID=UPI00241F8A67
MTMAMVNVPSVRVSVIENRRVFVKMVVRFAYSYPLIVVMLMVFIIDMFMFMHSNIVQYGSVKARIAVKWALFP